MPHHEERFTAHRVDTQFEQCAQAVPSSSDTANKHVVASLRSLYGEHIQQEQQSIERIRQRLSLSVAASQQEKQDGTEEQMSDVYEVVNVPEKRVPARLARPRRPWRRILEQGVAVLLVLALVVGWFALSHLPRPSRGTSAVFSDASARPLGAPISTIQGNFSGGEEWSPDGHALVSLQVNTQKHALEVHMLDVASRHSTSYPVLDSSWIPAVDLYDPFQILMGRYLLAVRAQGKNQATLGIWDISGQRAITTQAVPAQIGINGQVQSPWIVPSENEQKLAVFSPDGTVTIWDVASGQKLITCEGKIPLLQDIPHIRWYDHGQDLLFSHVGRDGHSQLQAWDVATGARLFSLNAPNRTYDRPSISPDSNYLALEVGPHPSANGSFQPDTLEIRDAHAGQVLRTYHLNGSREAVASFFWLPDSRRLVSMDEKGASATVQKMQVRVWDVFTNQTTFTLSLSYSGPIWNSQWTPNGQYLVVSNSDGRSMDIWQMSNGHKVATVATPGVYARSDSFFYVNNQQMVIGEKGTFDIWDIATGKLMYKYHGSTPFSLNGVSGSVVFWSPDGKYLSMLAGKTPSIGDGILSIWRIP